MITTPNGGGGGRPGESEFAKREDDPTHNPIICSPYEQPSHHWTLDDRGRATKPKIAGRRPSSLMVSFVPDAKTKQGDDTTSKRINTLRKIVDQWRRNGWPGVTSVTRSLLEYWTHDGRSQRLYWAQIEALETLIWLYEVAPSTPEAADILVELDTSNKDHNDFLRRLSSKMATGTGKTVVMAMIITWHTCNYKNNPQQFSNQFIVITPGLIIRDRLEELIPKRNHVYDRMDLVPPGLSVKSAHVKIVNYQSFQARDKFTMLEATGAEKKFLKTRNPNSLQKSDPVMLPRDLVDLNAQHNVVVINDEAHHCYKPGTGRLRAENKDDQNRVALWFNAVKLIDKSFSELLRIYDLSATPKFIERGEKRMDSLFPWTVSDFPITDAIESGMVKIPRVPTSTTGLESGVCRNVFENTPKNTRNLDSQNMPREVIDPLNVLYKAYEEKFNLYRQNYGIPPVFIIVADTIDNARAFYEYVAGTPVENNNTSDHVDFWHDGHCKLFSNNPTLNNDSPRTIMVHSRIDENEHFKLMKKILKGLKPSDPHKTKTEAEIVRDVLATVGKKGKPGEQVRCVISVSMLTEGWDAKNVTHVFGYRPFGTQLLCEQVSGRALRRSDTDSPNWYKIPTFAEIFGVPFDYMVDTDADSTIYPPTPKVYVFPKDQSHDLIIKFPLVESYSYQVSSNATITLDPSKVRNYVIHPPVSDPSNETLTGIVGLTQKIEPPHISLQASKFQIACSVVKEWLRPKTTQNEQYEYLYNNMSLFAQMKRNVDLWFSHPKIEKENGFEPYWLTLKPHSSDIPHEIIKACNIVKSDIPVRPQAIFSSLSPANTNNIHYETSVSSEHLYESPVKCQHNCAPCHSKLEVDVAKLLDRLDIVLAWTRNHNPRFGWSIPYFFQEHWQRYYPDFIARLKPTSSDSNNLHAVIEVKGISDDLSKTKAAHVRDIWIQAVQDAGFGRWEYVYIEDLKNAAKQIELAREGSN